MNENLEQEIQVPVTTWFDDPADTELLDILPSLEHLNGVSKGLIGEFETFWNHTVLKPNDFCRNWFRNVLVLKRHSL